MIKVQAEAFDVGAEYKALKAIRHDVGGFALFVGSVRDDTGGTKVSAMTLEHYPGMTESALTDIETEARTRWSLADVLIIHRFGRLLPGDDIVLVITAATHRADAFAACEFLMDYLKTSAPFWKLEEDGDQRRWVDAKVSDDEARARWQKP
jgi:molybdopterin synthase catalytic subunit